MPQPDRPLSIAGHIEELEAEISRLDGRAGELDVKIAELKAEKGAAETREKEADQRILQADMDRQQMLDAFGGLVSAKQEIRRLEGVVRAAVKLLATEKARAHDLWCRTYDKVPEECNCSVADIGAWLDANAAKEEEVSLGGDAPQSVEFRVGEGEEGVE